MRSELGSRTYAEDGAVQIGEDDDVELLRLADHLHGCVIDDHLLERDAGVLILRRDFLARPHEQTITELHDVGLVNTGDLLALVLDGEVEGEARDPLRLCSGHDLERFDDTGDRSVLEARVLALRGSEKQDAMSLASVFSRMTTKSTSLCRDGTPGIELQSEIEA